MGIFIPTESPYSTVPDFTDATVPDFTDAGNFFFKSIVLDL